MAKDVQVVMLASGSKGNAALISTDCQRFLVDVGISCRELVKRMQMSGAKAYLVNTGWNGTGKRISIKDTRGIIDAIHSGAINEAPTKKIPYFGLEIPTKLEGVATEVLDPKDTYKDPSKSKWDYKDESEWDTRAKKLAQMFIDNFAKKYADTEIGKGLVAAFAGEFQLYVISTVHDLPPYLPVATGTSRSMPEASMTLRACLAGFSIHTLPPRALIRRLVRMMTAMPDESIKVRPAMSRTQSLGRYSSKSSSMACMVHLASW